MCGIFGKGKKDKDEDEQREERGRRSQVGVAGGADKKVGRKGGGKSPGGGGGGNESAGGSAGGSRKGSRSRGGSRKGSLSRGGSQGSIRAFQSGYSGNKYQKECLQLHNYYRDLHGVKPLKLDEYLCQQAQNWAESLKKMDNKVEHSPLAAAEKSTIGECIYFDPKKNAPIKKIMDIWYSEIKNYDFTFLNNQPNTGHMTQIIWKSTERLGVGYLTYDKGTHLVCLYQPTGNVYHQYRKEIVPPKTWKPPPEQTPGDPVPATTNV